MAGAGVVSPEPSVEDEPGVAGKPAEADGRSSTGGTFTYAARRAAPADQPRLIQAGLNPVETARQAGQAVAYSLALAQDGVKPETPPATAVSTSVPAAAPAPAPRAAKPVERPPETAPAKPEIAVAAASA